MGYRIAADIVVWVHLIFIVFVMLGGLLVLRCKWVALLHVPAAAWGMAVEFLHLYCPLTPLENLLRARAGQVGYSGGFVEHHLIGLIYPVGLTPDVQLWLGASVVAINLLMYGLLIRRWRRRHPRGE
jgi:uncharacterized protein YybS (DUF2232 family)